MNSLKRNHSKVKGKGELMDILYQLTKIAIYMAEVLKLYGLYPFK